MPILTDLPAAPPVAAAPMAEVAYADAPAQPLEAQSLQRLRALPDNFVGEAHSTLSGNVLANDYSPTGGALTATLVSRPPTGEFALQPNGDFLYTPARGTSGSTSFRYLATDEAGNSASAYVTLQLVSTNQRPVANSDSFFTFINTPVSGNVLANDYDPEGAPLSATASVVTGYGGRVDIAADGTFTYQPRAGYVGNDYVYYSLSDGERTASGSLSIQVLAPNMPPKTLPDYFLVTPGGVATGNVLRNDYDPEGTTLTAGTPTDWASPSYGGTLSLSADGSFTFTPEHPYPGNSYFYYETTDATGLKSHTQAATMVMISGDTAQACPEYYHVTPGESVSGNVLANDYVPAGTAVTAVLEAQPDQGSMTLAADGRFTYSALADATANTSHYVLYRLVDAAGTTLNRSWVGFLVSGSREKRPQAQADSYYVSVDGTLRGNVLANDYDPEGSPLSALLMDGPRHGSAELAADGSFVYRPQAGYNGTDGFRYSVSDVAGSLSPYGKVSIQVGAPDAPPVVLEDAYYVVAGKTLSGNVLTNDFDPEGRPLTTELGAPPRHGEVALNGDGSFVYTPSPDFSGGDYFYYVATDGGGNRVKAVVRIVVVPAS